MMCHCPWICLMSPFLINMSRSTHLPGAFVVCIILNIIYIHIYLHLHYFGIVVLYCFVQLQGSNEVGEMWNICLWGTGSICPSPAAALPPNIGGSCLVLPSGQPCVPIPPWGADMCERYVRSHNSPHPALASNRQEQPQGRLMQSSDYSISMIGRI